MTPCPRCGRADGTHTGYHEDAELPIRRGDRVRVRAGDHKHPSVARCVEAYNQRCR